MFLIIIIMLSKARMSVCVTSLECLYSVLLLCEYLDMNILKRLKRKAIQRGYPF